MPAKRRLVYILVVLVLFGLACSIITGAGSTADSEVQQDPTATTELEAQLKETEQALEATITALNSEETTPEEPLPTEVLPTEAPPLFSQWATNATASSEYGSPDYGAVQALGPPNTLECGDYETAWASADGSGVDWLEVSYDAPVVPTEITIFQSHTPDQIVMVEVKDLNGTYHLVHANEPHLTDCPYENVIAVDLDFQINAIRITVDQSVVDPPWDEIDAVELTGYAGGEAQGPVSTAAPTESPSDTPPENAGNIRFKYAPQDVEAGAFIYEIVGDNRDTLVEGSILQDQSTSQEYVLGLNSDGFNYSVTLFLPFDIPDGVLTLSPYDKGSPTKAPNLAIFVRTGFYYTQSGYLVVQDNGDGTISGSFSFTAAHESDDTRTIVVEGAFNQISLP